MPARARDIARRVACCAAWIVATLAAAAPLAAAQAVPFKPAVQWEARLDALAGPPAAAEAGFGANVAAGYYVRIGLDAAMGAAARDGGAATSARADFVARYLLDPFRQFKWGPYAGGGFTAQWDRRANCRGDLLVLVGLEGPVHAGWRPAVELGLGGGARLGVVLRRARSNGR
jgi:hypothetical protein